MTVEFYKTGKLEGNRKVYYSDGTLAEDTNYKAGIKYGTLKYFQIKENLLKSLFF